MDMKTRNTSGKCPFTGDGGVRSLLGRTNRDWWPEALQLDILTQKRHVPRSDGRGFRLCRGVQHARLRGAEGRPHRADDRQPAVVAGRLRPLRPVLHPHGVARRGHLSHRRRPRRCRQRAAAVCAAQFAGPTTATSTRRAACCGRSSRNTASNISWADLFILAGNVAIESMGGPVFGFGGGRADVFEPESDVYWGTEEQWVNEGVATRIQPKEGMALENPLAAIQMGLIYVNPEGPGGNPDPLRKRARHARNLRPHGDERRGNRRADRRRPRLRQGPRRGSGRHLRRCARKRRPRTCMGFGWLTDRRARSAKGNITTSGIEGAWIEQPDQWSRRLFPPAVQVRLRTGARARPAPSSGSRSTPIPKTWPPTRATRTRGADDDDHRRHGAEDGPGLSQDFRTLPRRPGSSSTMPSPARGSSCATATWGPRSAISGPEVPAEDLIWQDPVPAGHAAVGCRCRRVQERKILGSGLTVSELVKAAWASASTYRNSDHRGGANGARVRLAPQKDWAANDPDELAKVLGEDRRASR